MPKQDTQEVKPHKKFKRGVELKVVYFGSPHAMLDHEIFKVLRQRWYTWQKSDYNGKTRERSNIFSNARGLIEDSERIKRVLNDEVFSIFSSSPISFLICLRQVTPKDLVNA